MHLLADSCIANCCGSSRVTQDSFFLQRSPAPTGEAMSQRRHRLLRTAMRLFSFDSERTAPVCGTAEDNLFYCACEYMHSQHSVNCPTKIKALGFKDSEAEMLKYWELGYDAKEPVTFPSKGTHFAFLMGRDCRGTFTHKTPHFTAQPAAT